MSKSQANDLPKSRSRLTSAACRVKYQTSNGTRPSRASTCQSGTWYWMGCVVRIASTIRLVSGNHLEKRNPSVAIISPAQAVACANAGFAATRERSCIASQLCHTISQIAHRSGRHDKAAFTFGYNFCRAAFVRADHRQCARHRFDLHLGESLKKTWKNKRLRAAHQRRELRLVHSSKTPHLLQPMSRLRQFPRTDEP